MIIDEILKYAEIVNREIEKDLKFELDILENSAKYVFEAGGKRLRPFLTMKACEACGGNATDALHAGLAIEYIHNFSLIQDDIIDEDKKRRGRRTLHHAFGKTMGIFVGDILFSKVVESLGKVSIKTRRIVDVVAKASIDLCIGEIIDVEFERRESIELEDYMVMITKKTASLYHAAAKCGAIIGGGKKHEIEALSQYGLLVGKAFQIWDDVLDLVGDEKKLGKSVGSDLKRGKKTLIVVHFLKNAEKKDIKEFLKIFGREDGNVERAREFLESCHSIEYAKEQAKKLVENAKNKIKVLKETEAKNHLFDFADFTVSRNY